MNRTKANTPPANPQYDKLRDFYNMGGTHPKTLYRRYEAELRAKEQRLDPLMAAAEMEIEMFLDFIENWVFPQDDQAPVACCEPLDEQYSSVFVVTYH